jgi:hypothetical protein
VQLRLGRGRDHVLDQTHRTLVQDARRLTVCTALDPPTRGVWRVGRDAAQSESAGVCPRAVVVAVGQENGTVGHDRI